MITLEIDRATDNQNMHQSNGTNGTNDNISQEPGSELWRHSSPESTQMWNFLQVVNKEKGLQLKNYKDLYNWSIAEVADFWAAVWQFTGIKASAPYEEVRSISNRPTDHCNS